MENRYKATEFIEDGAIIEVFEKVVEDRTYFDIVCSEETGKDRATSPYIQRSRVPSLVICAMRALEYISDRHRDLRKGAPPGLFSGADAASISDASNVFTKRTEFKVDSVVVEVCMDESEYPHVRCLREHMIQGERRTSWWIQQRDIRSLVIALSQAQKYMDGRR